MSIQYEVDVLISDTILVEADSVSSAYDAAWNLGYRHVTDIRPTKED